VPEGLPLAVSMSMAFSIDKLINDKMLIKNIEALEVAGSVNDILTGKTSTLTKGELKVTKVIIGMDCQNAENAEFNSDLKKLMIESVILNNDARLEISGENGDYRYEPKGNAVDVSLCQYLTSLKVPIFDKLVDRERDY
jgi:Ca2+-transporting ATPase